MHRDRPVLPVTSRSRPRFSGRGPPRSAHRRCDRSKARRSGRACGCRIADRRPRTRPPRTRRGDWRGGRGKATAAGPPAPPAPPAGSANHRAIPAWRRAP
ncbi:hypothetical protein F1189_09220 [Rhodovastum atsumiense]|uniref:Uncharacterized protein n=1 Tax=Rhodovastum atsumiense TaxID=504468 RepID=A0A5M6IWB4_9PROT|nr:hypothetical protein F1189_09220 [Rhodovastum atsumiense]